MATNSPKQPLSDNPLPKMPIKQKLIILVSGDSCAGKDYCANIWVAVFKGLKAQVVSISNTTKQEYANATGADLKLLLSDRTYKEKHRPALTKFFQDQVRKRPRLLEEQFLDVVSKAADLDVLFVTGMRDEAPLVALSPLVPDSRLLDIRVESSREVLLRRGHHARNNSQFMSNSRVLDYCPSFTFHNNSNGIEVAKKMAENYLLPFMHEDLQRLANMVCKVSDFPRLGIEFHHVLGISQQPHGLNLCTSLLQTRFTGDWASIDAIACCEAGGFVYASALGFRVNLPLVLIRDAGKLPPPTISVPKSASFISSSASAKPEQKLIEVERDVVSKMVSIVVVDDVLSTGETLCTMLQLLSKASIKTENINIMVVAEFPAQRGRNLLRQRGFGKVNIQSLLVFGGS
jgi:adenine phosphoribosyltransferase/phosphomevalonate kinase